MTTPTDDSPARRPSKDQADGLLCRKTHHRVPADDPHCPARARPCGYRINCVIYAMEEYNSGKLTDRAPADRVRVGPEGKEFVLIPAFLPHTDMALFPNVAEEAPEA